MAILARRLFSFYHAQEVAADIEIFLAAVVELFCYYPEDIVLRAVSPTFGLPGKYKFPPRLAEIREFLEDEMQPIYRERDRQARLMPPEPPVNRERRLSYDELKAKYGDNWGINAEQRKPQWQPPSPNQLKAIIGQDEWDKIPNQK